MNVITHYNPEMVIRGFGGLAGAQYDAQIAREALATAREALAETWRNRNAPLWGWTARNMSRNYPFWRHHGLASVMRCRAAVRRYEAEVREITTSSAVEDVAPQMAAE